MCRKLPVRGVLLRRRDAFLDLDLDARQRRPGRDVVRRDADDSEERRDVLPELRGEEVVGRPVAEAVPDVGVDVRHHQVHLALREAVEGRRLRVRGSLGQHEADEPVVAPGVRLLVGGVGLAVEDEGEPAAVVGLDGRGIGELAAVVGEDDGEEAREHLAPPVAVAFLQLADDGREHAQHARARLRVDEEREHEAGRVEDERRQGLPAPGALDRVHLHDAHARIGLHEREIVLPRPADAAGLVHPALHALALARLDHARPGQLPALRRQQPAVDVAVDRLLGDGEPVGVGRHGRMDALALGREVAQQGVEGEQLALGDVRARARLGEDRLVVRLRLAVQVVALPQDAPALVRAPVADERRVVQPLALLLDERGAVRIALAAELALPSPVVEAVCADLPPPALHPERAPVRDAVGRALVGFDRAGLDLPRDRRHGTRQRLRYRVHRLAGPRHRLNREPVRVRQSWLLHLFSLVFRPCTMRDRQEMVRHCFQN